MGTKADTTNAGASAVENDTTAASIDNEGAQESSTSAASSARESAMDLIIKNRHEEFNADQEEAGSTELLDTGETIVEDEGTEGIAAEEPAEIPPEEPVEVPAPVESDPEPTTPKGAMVSVELDDGTTIQVPATNIRTSVKLDGVESEIPLDQMTRDYQKSATGSKRLTEAAVKAKALDVREKSILLREQQLPEKGVVTPAPPSPEDVQKRAKDFAEALYSGDQETTEKAIADMLTAQAQPLPVAPATPVMSVDDMARSVAEKIDIDSAGKEFAKNFGNIVANKALMAQADIFADELAIEYPTLTRTELFQKTGERTQEWIREMAGVSEPIQEPVTPQKTVVKATNMDKRRVRKAQTVQKIPTSGKVAGLGEIETPPQTSSDVIAEMRGQRGQRV